MPVERASGGSCPDRLSRPAAVLFDLDGTLADTAPDLGRCMNALLAEAGRAAMDDAALRPYVSGGGVAMIAAAFGSGLGASVRNRLHQRFLELYGEHLADSSRLFPGVGETLDAIEAAGGRWGVVTNKFAAFTLPLMRALGLDRRASCMVSGDSAARAKPHPDPLLLACRKLALAPGQCVYIGDHRRDIDAARAAGMPSLAAAYGYLGVAEDPHTWGADGVVHDPRDLPGWLGLA